MSFLKSLFSFKTENNPAIRKISAGEFKKELTSQSVQLVDVRTKAEYNKGHIKNAILIDFFTSKFKNDLALLDTQKPLYLYCRSGVRSGKAAKVAFKLGFTTIVDLKGGYLVYANK